MYILIQVVPDGRAWNEKINATTSPTLSEHWADKVPQAHPCSYFQAQAQTRLARPPHYVFHHCITTLLRNVYSINTKHNLQIKAPKPQTDVFIWRAPIARHLYFNFHSWIGPRTDRA